MSINRAASGTAPVTATLIIDFGTHTPSYLAGNIVRWNETNGQWHYSASPSNESIYIFMNVTANQPDVWSLMLASAKVMNMTTGGNLTTDMTYYPAYQDYLITGIEGVHSTNTLFWQYTVNGQPAIYGVMHQKIADGYVIEWQLLPSQGT